MKTKRRDVVGARSEKEWLDEFLHVLNVYKYKEEWKGGCRPYSIDVATNTSTRHVADSYQSDSIVGPVAAMANVTYSRLFITLLSCMSTHAPTHSCNHLSSVVCASLSRLDRQHTRCRDSHAVRQRAEGRHHRRCRAVCRSREILLRTTCMVY